MNYRDPTDDLIRWEFSQNAEDGINRAWSNEIHLILAGDSRFMDKDALLEYICDRIHLSDMMMIWLTASKKESEGNKGEFHRAIYSEMVEDSATKQKFEDWARRQ